MNNYTVYIHIFPNRKVYIGITKQKPENRWRNGKKYNSEYMRNAISKYGWENVEHKILYNNLTKEEAELKEIELIKQYRSNEKDFGYNILEGGNVSNGMTNEMIEKMSIERKGKHYSPRTEFKKGHKPWTTGKKMSVEFRQKLSESHKNKIISDETRKKLSENNARYWKGKKRSEETIRKMSESMKGKKGYWNGKHHTEETKNKISQSKKGTISLTRKKVICIETDIIYDSLTEASIKTKANLSKISNCCNGKLKTAGGYHWQFLN